MGPIDDAGGAAPQFMQDQPADDGGGSGGGMSGDDSYSGMGPAPQQLPFAALHEVGPGDADQSNTPPELQRFIDKAGQTNWVNKNINVPVTQGGPPTEAGAGGAANSTDMTVRRYVEQYVWQVIKRAKQRRLGLEQEWLDIQRMVVLMHDENQRYKGRSQAYWPMYARSRKSLISQYMQALFPTDEYMGVTDREQGDNEQAKAVQETVEYEFENSGIFRTLKGGVGQFVDLGIMVAKGFYRTNRIVKGTEPSPEKPDGMDTCVDEGFQVSCRSIFNVVVYPEWAESKRELQVEAERLEVPIAYVWAMDKSKRWENLSEALSSGGKHTDEFDWVNTATLADVAGIPNTMELRGVDGSPVQEVIIVEAWFKMVLPDEAYAPTETKGLPLPCRCVFVNGVAVEVRRNPFYHQSSPFEYARDNVVAGSFYAFGSGHLTKEIQYLANDAANQLNDAATFTVMPQWLANTNYFSGAMEGMRPNKVWKVRDIDKAIKPISPAVEVIQYGQTYFQQLLQQGQNASGSPAVNQGQKGAETATATEVLAHNSSGPIQETAKDIAHDVIVPLMKMAWELSRQFRTQEFIRKMADGSLVRWLPSEIEGTFDFKFLSADQAMNRSARQQGLQLFTQLAGQLKEQMQLMGMMLNPTEILKRAWSDGLGFRAFDRVVIPMPPPPGAPPGMPPGAGGPPPGGPGIPPGGPGQAPPRPGPNGGQISPTEQNPNHPATGPNGTGPANAVPGTGDHFLKIRQLANDDAAKKGGGLGGGITPY